MPRFRKIIPVYYTQRNQQKGRPHLTHTRKQIDVIELLRFVGDGAVPFLVHGPKGKANVGRRHSCGSFERVCHAVATVIFVFGRIAPGTEKHTRDEQKERRPFHAAQRVDAKHQGHGGGRNGIARLNGFNKVRRRLGKGRVGTQKVQTEKDAHQDKVGMAEPGEKPF